jgi:hypothetical protein
MLDEASLRRQLTAIEHKTETAESLTGIGGWWESAEDGGPIDVAGKRRALDDLAKGRLAWLTAHESAKRGLAALDEGDIELAAACLTNGLWLYIEVLEKRARPSERKKLGKAAGRRGRPRKKVK